MELGATGWQWLDKIYMIYTASIVGGLIEG
jgi:hypothetical protein